jgi:hypothetical protein
VSVGEPKPVVVNSIALAVEPEQVPYSEPLTAGGCTRNAHVELTRGLKGFESKKCPQCGLEVYRP